MGKINQLLDETRDEKANADEDIISEEERRDNFVKEEQQEDREKEAFKLGKSRRNLYEELSREGIEDGQYTLTVQKVTAATTAGGKPIIRLTYRLEEEYQFKGEDLRNVHINITSSDEWNDQYQTNFALQTLGQMFDILGASDEDVEMSTQGIVTALQEQLDAGLNEKTFEANVRARRIRQDDNNLVFYTVYPK